MDDLTSPPSVATRPKFFETPIAWLRRKIRRRKEKFARRAARALIALGWTNPPPGSIGSDVQRMELASGLLRLAEMGDAKQFFQAHDLLLRCAPASLLPISARSEAQLECLAAFGERDFIVEIADRFVPAAPQDGDRYAPWRVLQLAAACAAVGAEEQANRLLSSFASKRAGEALGCLAAIYPLRELFPPHWHRRDAAGLVTFLNPGVEGRPPTTKVTLPLPFQGCALVERARVVGAFNVIDDRGRLLVYDHGGHPRLPRVAGHRLEVRGTALAVDRAAVFFPYSHHERLPVAIHLAGRCAENYFHWIVEYLPRLLTAIEGGADAQAKLLVRADMPPSMRRALDIVSEGQFAVHELAPGALLEVDRLFVPSMHSCVVDGGALPLNRIGALSPRHLRFVRERVLRHVERIGGGPPLPRKVYLTRGKRPRALRTEPEIIAALVAEGFAPIDPAQLAFEDQVRLFRDAETIVAAGGAALTNLLFCDNNPDVLVLLGAQNAGFPLFYNVLQIAGDGRYCEAPGPSLLKAECAINEEQYINADYEVSAKQVARALGRMRETN